MQCIVLRLLLLFFFLDYTCSTKFIYSKDDFDIWLTQKYIMNIMKNIKFKNLKIYTYLKHVAPLKSKLSFRIKYIPEIYRIYYTEFRLQWRLIQSRGPTRHSRIFNCNVWRKQRGGQSPNPNSRRCFRIASRIDPCLSIDRSIRIDTSQSLCVCACLLRPFDGFHSFSPPPQHSFSDCSEWSANWSDVILRKLVVGMECRTSVTVSSDEYRGWYNLAGGVRRLLLGGKLGWMIFSFFFLSSRDYKDSLAFRTNSEMVN